jgi:HSP90 family molecular chaperone
VLPDPLAPQTIVVEDDGTGMTSQESRNEYLNIASDKRSRINKETPGLNRKLKGRKGIGKFAGLMIAERMQIESVARGKKCTLIIDKKELIENESDLEKVPLSLDEAAAEKGLVGTKITLSLLDDSLLSGMLGRYEIEAGLISVSGRVNLLDFRYVEPLAGGFSLASSPNSISVTAIPA